MESIHRKECSPPFNKMTPVATLKPPKIPAYVYSTYLSCAEASPCTVFYAQDLQPVHDDMAVFFI
eukprot:1153051-Pelagomonas_calceolata.AAC.3